MVTCQAVVEFLSRLVFFGDARMNVIKQWWNNANRYLWEAAARIFSPIDDNYPMIGVQPFEGEIVRGYDPKW